MSGQPTRHPSGIEPIESRRASGNEVTCESVYFRWTISEARSGDAAFPASGKRRNLMNSILGIVASVLLFLGVGRSQVNSADSLQPTPLEEFAQLPATHITWSSEV